MDGKMRHIGGCEAAPQIPVRPARRVARMVFRCVVVLGLTALLLAAVEGVLAICGVAPMRFEEDPYVGFAGQYPLFIEERDVDGAPTPYMVTAPNKLTYFNHQRFLKKKPENGYRIFSLGGSTTYGHPYQDNVSFSGWLRAFLEDGDPSRTWEVVNAGGISYASYRVCLLMEELSQYEPDLFIVYTGQNEFLERRTYPEFATAPRVALEMGAAVRHLRSYAVMRRAANKARTEMGTRSVLQPEVTAILDHANGPWAYERDDALRDGVLNHFAYNLDRMAKIAAAAGARIIFVTPARRAAAGSAGA